MRHTLEEQAAEAWLYGLPLIEMAATRTRVLRLGVQQNRLHHVHRLLTPRDREVTLPNNDTLYSSAHLDLSHGPATLTLPPAGERYLSFALMDAWTNNFAILGTRTTGAEGGTFRIVGPSSDETGPMVIRAPTDFVWGLARVLVDGPADLEAARAVQQAITLDAPAARDWTPLTSRTADWADYLAAVDAMMVANPPPATDLALRRRIAGLGIGEGRFDPTRFSPDAAQAIATGVQQARHWAVAAGGIGARAVDGWLQPGHGVGDFGQDYRYRAAVALKGLAAMPSVEALYLQGTGTSDGLYDGTRQWRLHFAADTLPPVDGFWSLTMYEAADDGQMFLTANPLQRYSIGDRTPGLAKAADGRLTIAIGHEPPADVPEVNWLPAPAGPFGIVMRAYLPHTEWLYGIYRMPPLQPAD